MRLPTTVFMLTTESTALLQERWQHLFEAIPAGHFKFILSREGCYQALQVPDVKRLWLPEEAHIGKTIEEVLPPDLVVDRRYYFDKAVSTGKPQIYAYPRYERAKHFEVEITPLPDFEEVLMTVCDVVISRVPEAYIVPR